VGKVESPEVFLLLAAYVLSPFSIGWASRSVSGALKGFLTGLALVLTLLWGFFSSNYFGLYLLGLRGPVLTFFSSITSLLLLLPGWRLYRWAESLAAAEEGLRQKIYTQIKDEIARPFNQMARRLDEVGSTMREMANSIHETRAEVSTLVGRLDKNFSSLVNHFNDFQLQLELTCGEVRELREEFRNFQKPAPKDSEINHGRPPATLGEQGSERRVLTTEDGRKARLSGTEWQKRTAGLVREIAEAEHLSIEVENSLEKGVPDILIRIGNKICAIGACKAYTLFPFQPGERRTPQRTVIPSMIVAERNSALKHKVPLFIVVVNQRTGVPWFHIVPCEELKSFRRVTTPSWLAEDRPPEEGIKQNHGEFIEFLKRLFE
jgi:hypothetical protein